MVTAMKIAVIDDERLARKELIHQILETLPDSQIEEADSGSSALSLISSKKFDLLFIDINLNDMEGTTLAAAAKKLLPKAQIVFATAYSQYAVKAFELGVDNYILKPFDPARVHEVLEICLEECEKDAPASVYFFSKIPISNNRTTILVDIADIVYIETSGRGCIIHTPRQDFTENLLIGEYEKRLSPQGFCRVHKSFLINLNYISEVFPWLSNSLGIRLKGFQDIIIPVSREKVRLFKQLIGM